MAKVKQKVKKRSRKIGGSSGYKKCSNCGGDGRVRVRSK